MADLGAITYSEVIWTSGDVITEAKLDNMVANDQAYDSHSAQGLLLNNAKALAGKVTGGTAYNLLIINGSNILEIGDSSLDGIQFNHKITKRVGTTASSATPTPAGDDVEIYTVTALATGATFGAPTGTPLNGQTLIIRVKDNGTARTLAFNAIYRFSTDILAPTTTVISKTIYLGFIYNSADSKWDCIAKVDGF